MARIEMIKWRSSKQTRAGERMEHETPASSSISTHSAIIISLVTQYRCAGTRALNTLAYSRQENKRLGAATGAGGGGIWRA